MEYYIAMTNPNAKLQAIKNKLSDMREFVRKADDIRTQIEYIDERISILLNMKNSEATKMYVSDKSGVYYQLHIPSEISSSAISAAIVELERDLSIKNKELEQLLKGK